MASSAMTYPYVLPLGISYLEGFITTWTRPCRDTQVVRQRAARRSAVNLETSRVVSVLATAGPTKVLAVWLHSEGA